MEAEPTPTDRVADLTAMLAQLLDVMAEDSASFHPNPCDGSYAADCGICREVQNARALIEHDLAHPPLTSAETPTKHPSLLQAAHAAYELLVSSRRESGKGPTDAEAQLKLAITDATMAPPNDKPRIRGYLGEQSFEITEGQHHLTALVEAQIYVGVYRAERALSMSIPDSRVMARLALQDFRETQTND